jgi:hypothetical protein
MQLKFVFKNKKKYLFFDSISNKFNLAKYFFPLILFNQFYVHGLCCEIKYLDRHSPINHFKYIFSYH